MPPYVKEMTDKELHRALSLFGYCAGPVDSSTRPLYERVYMGFLSDESAVPRDPKVLFAKSVLTDRILQPSHRLGSTFPLMSIRDMKAMSCPHTSLRLHLLQLP